MLKHRGVARFPLFLATFGAIAGARTVRWRTFAVPRRLGAAIAEGVAAWRRGPDQTLPTLGDGVRDGGARIG